MTARNQRAGRFFAGGNAFFHSVSWAVLLAALASPSFAAETDAAKKAYEKGKACRDKSDYDGAIAAFSETVRLDPKYGDAFRGRGYAYACKRDDDKAIADFNEAIRLNPKDVKALYDRGGVYGRKGDHDKAIAEFTVAMRLDPKNSILVSARGYGYLNKGEFDKAVGDFTEAIRLNAECSGAYVGRAAAYECKHELDKAIADYGEALRINPKDAHLYDQRGSAFFLERVYDKALADYAVAIRLNPKDTQARGNRALAYNQQGNCEKAIAELDSAIAIDPRTFSCLELRAALRVCRGDYDGGIGDLRAAVALDPNDPAAKFEHWAKKPLTAEAVAHGKRQIRQMLQDRPAMAKYSDKAAVLYDWAERKFAGEDLRLPIHWDSSEPPVAEAEHFSPTAYNWGRIRLRKTRVDSSRKEKEQTFEELWREAVFELYNITNDEDFRRAGKEAYEGRLTKEAYVAAIVDCESRAAEKTRAFYIHVFLPWAKTQRAATDPRLWYITGRLDCKENLILPHVDRRSFYWASYELNYDAIAIQSLAAKGETKKAAALAVEAFRGAPTNDQKARIANVVSYAFQGQEDDVLAAFGEAIRLSPQDAVLYGLRGDFHELYHRFGEAIADYSEAIRIAPNNVGAIIKRGDAYLQLFPRNEKARIDAAGKAIADFTDALCLQPESFDPYWRRGRAYLNADEFDKAITDESEAIRLNPGFAGSYAVRATAYKYKGDKAKASADLATAEKLRQQNGHGIRPPIEHLRDDADSEKRPKDAPAHPK
jgi:tetratricopeptide (TPR) repeat protein